MERDTLEVLADVVLEHLYAAGVAASETGFLVSLPAYLDAAEVRLLQMEVNRRAVIDVELRHRLGERRVEVRAVRSRLRR